MSTGERPLLAVMTLALPGGAARAAGDALKSEVSATARIGRFREAVSVRYNKGFVPGDLPVSSNRR